MVAASMAFCFAVAAMVDVDEVCRLEEKET